MGASVDDYNYNGVLINADNNAVFDANDTSSNDSTFDNTDISVGGSGAAYVVAYEAYALADSTALQAGLMRQMRC